MFRQAKHVTLSAKTSQLNYATIKAFVWSHDSNPGGSLRFTMDAKIYDCVL